MLYDFTYTWYLEKQNKTKQMNKQNRNRLMDKENKQAVARGEYVGRERKQVRKIKRHKLPVAKESQVCNIRRIWSITVYIFVW